MSSVITRAVELGIESQEFKSSRRHYLETRGSLFRVDCFKWQNYSALSSKDIIIALPIDSLKEKNRHANQLNCWCHKCQQTDRQRETAVEPSRPVRLKSTILFDKGAGGVECTMATEVVDVHRHWNDDTETRSDWPWSQPPDSATKYCRFPLLRILNN